MANSLVKLTLESNQYERNLRQAQKTWNEFTKGIGLSMSKFTAVGAAIGAVTGALKVAKDAFMSSEENLDEWGRTVMASENLYKGFLNSLNSGNINGFLNNISTITEAARAAYDALDELGTFNAFNQIQTQKTRTGFTEAMAGYRMGEGSKEDVLKAARAYQEELRARQKRELEAYSENVRLIAADHQVPWGNLEQALTGNYGDYDALKKVMPSGKRTVYQAVGQFGATMSYEVPVAVTAEEKMGEALRKLTDTELQKLQALGAQAEKTGEEIAQIDKQMARVLNGRSQDTTGSSGSSTNRRGGGGNTKTEPTYAADSIAAMEAEVSMLTKAWKEAGAAVRDDYAAQLKEAQLRLDTVMGKDSSIAFNPEQAARQLEVVQGKNVVEIPLSSEVSFGEWLTDIQAQIANLEFEPIEIPIETTTNDVKAIAQAASITADVVGSIGDAFNAIEDPAAKVMGTVAQAIASVAMGYAQATVAAAQTGNPWVWAAFAMSGLATMITMISNIHSATGYAEGGIVGGTSYSGDNIPIMANAGELVLTKAQQNTLAQNLQGGGMGSMNLKTRVKGTELLVWLDNSLAQSGRGELVTWGT